MENLISWILIEKRGIAVLLELIEIFGRVEILEHYGYSYKMKIRRGQKSIGYVFGLFEDEIKKRFEVSEYSVSQTTLEQIFNSFAKEEYSNVSSLMLTLHSCKDDASS